MKAIYPIIETSNGLNILISHACFDELRKMYKDGFFSAIIKDLDGRLHSVLINQEKIAV